MFNTRTKRNSSHKEDSRQRKPFQSLTNMVLRSRKIITKVHNQTPKSVRKTQKNKKDTPRDDYEADILHYLREKEKRQKMAANFIEESSVSANNRQRLVDWMVRVSLVMDQETLELAVAIVDHSLSVVHSVQQELQVFGCVALLLAAKYNEVDFAPEELLELCPNLNSNNIFAMETRILSHLGFSLGLVLPCHFLKGLPLSNAMTELTVFFSNVAIYSALPLTSSQKTSTALHLSSLLLDQRVEHEKPTKNVLKLVAAVLDVHRSEKSLAVRDIYQEKTGGLTEAMSKTTDGVHWHLVRCVGGQMLSAAFVSWNLRKSSPMTHTVCHIMKIMAAILILLLHFQCRSQTPELIGSEILMGVKLLCFAGIAWNFFLLFLAGWPIGTSLAQNNRIGNCLYQLDAIASICIGIAWLAFPKWLLHRQVIVTLDESHELVGRIMGAFFVASYCASTHALHWQSKFDRGVAVTGRVVCCLAILSGQIWSQHAYGDDWSGGHWVGISLFSTWTVIAVLYALALALFGENSEKKKDS